MQCPEQRVQDFLVYNYTCGLLCLGWYSYSYYFEEMKYEEIAVLEGCAISSVEDSLEKAKEKLVNILKTLKK